LTTATRDYTLNLGKMTQKTQFKKRAGKAISSIRQHAARVMGTKDVRIDPKLNKFVWHKGIRNVPNRVRVRMSRKRGEDEDDKDGMYTLCQLVMVESFKMLGTEKVIDEDA